VRTIAWRGRVRPDRPIARAEARAWRRLPDTDNRVACRERYADLRRNGLCGKCKADSPKHAECLACRQKRVRS
jgi:hypothetical protein